MPSIGAAFMLGVIIGSWCSVNWSAPKPWHYALWWATVALNVGALLATHP